MHTRGRPEPPKLHSTGVSGIWPCFKSLLLRIKIEGHRPSIFILKSWDSVCLRVRSGKNAVSFYERHAFLSVNRRSRFTRERFKSLEIILYNEGVVSIKVTTMRVKGFKHD